MLLHLIQPLSTQVSTEAGGLQLIVDESIILLRAKEQAPRPPAIDRNATMAAQ